MVVLYVLIAVAVIGLLAGVHWYVWRRLVRDTTARGGWARRTGTAAAFVLPLTSVGALVAGRAGAPFPLQRALAWPGYLWLALLLYLTLALLVGEAVRPLLRAWVGRKPAESAQSADVRSTGGPAAAAGAAAAGPAAAGGPAAAVSHGDGGPAAPGGMPCGSSPTVLPSDTGAAMPTVTDGADAAGHAAAAVTRDAAVAGEGVGGVAEAAVGGTPAASAGGVAEGGLGSVGGAAGGGVVESGAGGAVKGGTAEAAASVGQVAEGGLGGSGGVADGDGADRVRGGGAGKGGAGGGALAVSRRLFVARTVAAAATSVAAGTVGYGAYTVLRGPRLKRITVPLAKLPRRAHGFRIAVVSDMHLGPILGRSHTQRVVETINRTHPDLIAVVGDLVDGSVADLGPAVEPLRRLSARYGSYFVTGNHEYYSGAAEWVDHVRELGLRPLENQRTELSGFDLAGVNDVAGESEGHGPDFDKALGDRDPARASVLLAHQPVVIHDAVKAGVDLQLSGHTHGGQLWPGTYLAELANPTAAGLDRYGDTQLYVSRGAGAWGPPVRVGAPPDVTVVELASPRA